MNTTKTVNTTKITKLQYHQSVMPAFCAWRKAMHKACGVETDMYCRLFTEKRSRGARTKYWYSYKDLPNTKIAEYINYNGYFTADGVVYKVTFQPESPIQSAILCAEKLNPIKFS